MEKKNILASRKVCVNDVDMYWILSTHDEYLVPCNLITRTTRLRNLAAYRIGSALARYICNRPVAEISKNADLGRHIGRSATLLAASVQPKLNAPYKP